jgi:hypothetical protein
MISKEIAIKNYAIYLALELKYVNALPNTKLHHLIVEFIESEENKLPISLQPYKEHVERYKKILRIYREYVLPIGDEMLERLDTKFNEIGEKEFKEWFTKQRYTKLEAVDVVLEQQTLDV